jgi:hypothetical protein
MKYLIAFMCIALFATAASADKQPEELQLSGTVRQVMAIGGETTGWALVLDFETAVGGKIFKEIELDPGDTNMQKYKGERAVVTGTLKEKTGVERGKYTVLQVKSIKKAE